VFSKLALFAAVGTFVAWASLPRDRRNEHRLERRLLLLAGLASAAGLAIFIAREAMPGIVQGGTRATEQRAISRLRELLFAQDIARQKGIHDPDADGVGSALLLGELTGELAVRGEKRLAPPLLERLPASTSTALGPAIDVGGYLFTICVPAARGGFTAMPGQSVDDERAERQYFAYAWPSGVAPGLAHAIALDQDERIWLAPSVPDLLRFGPRAPPACDDVSGERTKADWRVWRDKRARDTLPGER
jgi:hypothetical protein